MTRTSIEITATTVARARADVGKRQYEVGDTKVGGLCIRVRKEKATWSLRGRLGQKQTTWTIADLERLTAPSAARERALEAKRMLKRGIDPEEWLKEQDLGGKVERHFDPKKDGWLWEEARDLYLEHQLRENRQATYDDYRKTLKMRDFDGLKGRPLKSIQDIDYELIIEKIYKRARSQSNHTLRILKAMLGWCSRSPQKRKSLLMVHPMRDFAPLHREGRAAADERLTIPTPKELGQIPWAIQDENCHPSIRLACMLAMCSAQRRATVMAARREDFEPSGGLERGDAEGALWFIDGIHLKSDRPHVVPLPPLAWAAVQNALDLAPKNQPLLFPQIRLRKASDPGGRPMSENAVNRLLARCDFGHITLHDFRRAFGTHGEKLLGNSRAQTRLILDHVGDDGSDVTGIHYALHDRRNIRWQVMNRWCDFLEKLIAENEPKPETKARAA